MGTVATCPCFSDEVNYKSLPHELIVEGYSANNAPMRQKKSYLTSGHACPVGVIYGVYEGYR